MNLLDGAGARGLAGDSAEMVAARRAWLRRGHYEFLAEALTEAVGAARILADFGCGEGYYLDYVMRRTGADGYGTDLSKVAVAAAAKAYPQVQFAVADTNKLIPLADGSVDAGTCVFAPRSPEEFGRVIRNGGRLAVAIPGEAHLAALRERFGLMGIETDKAAKITAQLSERFILDGRQELQGSAELDGAELRELIEMTPNARHLDDPMRRALEDGGKAEFRFEILTFTRILRSNEIS
ncbi:MAG: hypothetical protein NVSMB39_1790 [Candidatus Saccharimonadales bacterium]